MRPRHLDDYVSRPALAAILDLYSSHVWCLHPIIDLDRLEHQLSTYYAGEVHGDDWFDMVLSMIGATIMQLPMSLQSLSSDDGRDLVERIRLELLDRLRRPFPFHQVGVERRKSRFHSAGNHVIHADSQS